MLKTRGFIAAAFAALAMAGGDALAACKDCGVVVDTRAVTRQGEGTGVGAVAGGVIGGVLGHQVGSGRGNTAATVAGAAGGAYVGHQVEKNQKTTTQHQVVVKMDDDGKTRYFNFKDPTRYRVGDKVRVVDGKLVRQK